jgi:hypothetical protein
MTRPIFLGEARPVDLDRDVAAALTIERVFPSLEIFRIFFDRFPLLEILRIGHIANKKRSGRRFALRKCIKTETWSSVPMQSERGYKSEPMRFPAVPSTITSLR